MNEDTKITIEGKTGAASKVDTEKRCSDGVTIGNVKIMNGAL